MHYNPGSPASIVDGCVCPMILNDAGVAPPYPPNGWLVRTDCPLHGTMTTAGLVDALTRRQEINV
jgi:hypothetical protein